MIENMRGSWRYSDRIIFDIFFTTAEGTLKIQPTNWRAIASAMTMICLALVSPRRWITICPIRIVVLVLVQWPSTSRSQLAKRVSMWRQCVRHPQRFLSLKLWVAMRDGLPLLVPWPKKKSVMPLKLFFSLKCPLLRRTF